MPPPPTPAVASDVDGGVPPAAAPAYFDRLLGSGFEDSTSDLSTLVTLQVTQQVLQSNFRDRLEAVLARHMERRRLHPTRLNISSRSAPAGTGTSAAPSRAGRPGTTIPRAAGAGARAAGGFAGANSPASAVWQMQRDMASMRADMAQMMLLLQASTEAQRDMQRQMRQEVSAVFHSVRQNADQHADLSGVSLPTATRPLGGKCVVCADAPADMVAMRCGHVCACSVCARQCAATGQACPICRAPVDEYMQVYPV